jgi:predicted lipid carrier protein YhbT
MVHETSVHCWDAQAANGVAEPVPAERAADGVDEYMDAIIHDNRAVLEDEGRLPAYAGERCAFHRTDGEGDWLVEFVPAEIRVHRGTGPADVTAAGPVSDLFLFLYGRVSPDRLEVSGDASLLDRWPELAGTF